MSMEAQVGHGHRTCKDEICWVFALSLIILATNADKALNSVKCWLIGSTDQFIYSDMNDQATGPLDCGHIMRTALFPVRSTLVKPHRATLSSVVGDHMRNCGAAIFFSLFFLRWLNSNMQLKFFVLQPEQEMEGVQVTIYDMQSPKCANHKSYLSG